MFPPFLYLINRLELEPRFRTLAEVVMANDFSGGRGNIFQGLGWMIPLLTCVCMLGLGGCDSGDAAGTQKAAKIKIGFLVKMPEEPWFQNEWKFAQQAADKDGFT